jgi:exodeoxyribonuclease VII small subunit
MARTKTSQGDHATGTPGKKKPSFEEALARLERIVEQLDDGELPLATSLELFKEGRTLAARCRELLEQAEIDVKRALDERPRGSDLGADEFTEDEADGA